MTLIVNEIHYDPSDARNSRIISAADRRISVRGSAAGEARKLFLVERLNLTVSYFGLASTRARKAFEQLAGEFIASDTSKSIADFAHALRNHLNREIDGDWLEKQPSGWHVCGFNEKGVPEMWFIRNIGGMHGLTYTNFQNQYMPATEELSSVHLTGILDESTGRFTQPFWFSFQNGDLRPFRPAWGLLDAFLVAMDAMGLTNAPKVALDHENRIKWKMSTLGLFFDNISFEKVIGGRIDVETLLPNI